MPAYLMSRSFPHRPTFKLTFGQSAQGQACKAKATAKGHLRMGAGVKWIDPVKPTAPSDEHIPSDWAKEAWIWAKDKGITDGNKSAGQYN